MPTDIVIPTIGESVSSGTVSSWLKSDGDVVARDEPVMELETDKVTMEILAPAEGVLRTIAKQGDEVKVGAVVGRVEQGSGVPAKSPASPPPPSRSEPTRKPSDALAGPKKGSSKPAAPVTDPVAPVGDVRATPLAKKLAEEHKVSLVGVPGTGASGRVREQDVLAIVQSRGVTGPHVDATEPAAPTSEPAVVPGGRGARRERMTRLRQRIAHRLVEAQHTAAMLTTFNEVDMTAVMELRKKYKEEFEKKHSVGLGFMSFFVSAATNALRAFPAVNACIADGVAGTGPEIEYHDYCDIAVAVGTDRGLVVPVLRDCHLLSFAGIEAGIKGLAEQARAGTLTLDQMQGGTFTITNGGVYGSLMSTPILNPPQAAILGMHAIKNRAVEDPTRPGQVALRPMMYLALSYDHRLIDGAEAVRFLVAIRNAVESPERLLLGV